jgi:hypothetical protein
MMSYRVFEQYIVEWIEKKASVIEHDNDVDEQDYNRFLDKSKDLQ